VAGSVSKYGQTYFPARSEFVPYRIFEFVPYRSPCNFFIPFVWPSQVNASPPTSLHPQPATSYHSNANNGVTAPRHPTRSKPESNCADESFHSLREAVDSFIKDLTSSHHTSSSSSIDIPPLDSLDGSTSFSYIGLLFHLEVPNGVGSDKIMVQTWFNQHRKN
jgi:hypothetical protein